MERLQKVIASAGVCSRRKAEELIREGKVKVNGVVVTTLGTKVDFNSIIEVEGKTLFTEDKVYFLLNKPRNCLTTLSDTRDRPTVMDCFPPMSYRIFPIGRLDFDTTGALIFTNDGDLANKLMHPRYEVKKQYRAYCKGLVSEDDIKKLTDGITLDDGFIKANSAKVIKYNAEANQTLIEIVVSEGRKHMVKKMVMYIGSTVIRLHRQAFAGISTYGLLPGQYRKLTAKEVEDLRK